MYLNDVPVGTYVMLRNRRTKQHQRKEFKLRVWKKVGDGVLQFVGGIKFTGEYRSELDNESPPIAPYRYRKNYRTMRVISSEEVATLFAL